MLGRIKEKMNRLHLVAFASVLASLMYSVSKYQSHLNPGAIKYGHKDEFRVFSTVWRTVVVLEFLKARVLFKDSYHLPSWSLLEWKHMSHCVHLAPHTHPGLQAQC